MLTFYDNIQYNGVKAHTFNIKGNKNNKEYNDTTNCWDTAAGCWSEQWDMHGSYSVNADKAWDDTKSAKTNEVYVGVTDTGRAPTLPDDLKGKVTDGLQFTQDDQGNVSFTNSVVDNGGENTEYHGTHVAGTIAANGNNIKGVAGHDDNVHVLAVKVLDDTGSGGFNAVNAGVEWALGAEPGYDLVPKDTPANPHPAKVINLSLGAQKSPFMSDSDWATEVQNFCSAWGKVVTLAHQKNATLVIAAGNGDPFTGQPTDVYDSLPAGCSTNEDVVVTATGTKGEAAFYSNTTNNPQTLGNNISVAAPGGNDSSFSNNAEQILSTSYDENTNKPSYRYLQGTSMATPHVVGTVALLYSLNPSLTYTDVNKVLSSSKTDNVLDADKAVKQEVN